MHPRHLYTVFDLLNQHERLGTDKTAIVDGDERISYPELIERVRRLAATLQGDRGKSDLQKGDRVAIFLRRSTDLVVAFLATHLAGGVAVILNDKLRARQVEYVVGHSEAKLFVTDASQLKAIPDAKIGDSLVRRIDEVELPASGIGTCPMIGKDLAMIMYTSGSSGMPKGVMLSHENLVAGAHTVSDYLQLSDRDVLISVLPFSFDYGLNQLLTMLLVGGTLVIQRSMFPNHICKTLLRERVTGMAGVPLFWAQLAERYSPFTKTSFPDLRYVTNSGGPFPQDLVGKFREAHPQTDLFLMYGLTEAFRSTYLPPAEAESRPGSMGKAIPNVEIVVVDEDGAVCGPDEPGELVHRGAHVSMGYWRDAEATARVFRKSPMTDSRHGSEEVVVYSGDLVKQDEKGYLYFLGRRDQMMKCQGVRLSPEEVEHYIRACGLVTAVVAFAVPRGADNALIAAIVPKDPGGFSTEALQEYCRREMPQYMQPAEFWTLGEVPQTSSGKIDRPRLKETYLAS